MVYHKNNINYRNLLFVSILITSCANSKVVPSDIDKLIACFGQDKGKLFEAMSLTEKEASADVSSFPQHPEKLPIKQRQKILNEEFSTRIMLHAEYKIVYGIEYYKNYTEA